MANKVLFGLKSVYAALYTESTGVWATPVAIPGAVNLSLSGEGDSSTFYADDIAYYVANQNNGYTGELEAALIPDALLASILGWEIDDNGVLVEISDAEAVPFALLFEVQGNEADKRYCFYKCTAGRPSIEHSTKNESIEPKTAVLPLTITPVAITPTNPTAWVTATEYALGARVLEGGNIYECTTAGTSGASEPTWPASGTVTDGTVTWTYQQAAHTSMNVVKGVIELSTANTTVYNAWFTAVTTPNYA